MLRCAYRRTHIDDRSAARWLGENLGLWQLPCMLAGILPELPFVYAPPPQLPDCIEKLRRECPSVHAAHVDRLPKSTIEVVFLQAPSDPLRPSYTRTVVHRS